MSDISTIEGALCDLNDRLCSESPGNYERLEEHMDELAILRAHSAMLRTIAEKHDAWWLLTVDHGTADECAGCGASVSGHSLYAEGEPGTWVVECTHAPSCWAAPIIAMMEGMGET